MNKKKSGAFFSSLGKLHGDMKLFHVPGFDYLGALKGPGHIIQVEATWEISVFVMSLGTHQGHFLSAGGRRRLPNVIRTSDQCEIEKP